MSKLCLSGLDGRLSLNKPRTGEINALAAESIRYRQQVVVSSGNFDSRCGARMCFAGGFAVKYSAEVAHGESLIKPHVLDTPSHILTLHMNTSPTLTHLKAWITKP